MAYSVTQRTNEIGIRLAMGARRTQMRAMVLRESSLLALAGIVAGVAGALLFTRAIRSMLYGITPNDPLTVIAGVALLLAIALVASWIPATRAAGVEPMEALRHEKARLQHRPCQIVILRWTSSPTKDVRCAAEKGLGRVAAAASNDLSFCHPTKRSRCVGHPPAGL